MKKLTQQKFFSYSILAILLLGCVRGEEVIPDSERLKKCRTGSAVRKTLIVGIDGVRTDALMTAAHPVFDSLIAHAYVNFHCDRGPYTVSAPGWSTILHGVYPAKHGVTFNYDTATNFAQYPDMFYYLRRHNPYFNLAVICNWYAILDITSNESYKETVYDASDGDLADSRVKTRALALINSCPPDVTVLHFANVDSRGHTSGFSPTNPAYINAIKKTGDYVGEIMTAIKQREQNNGEEWLVIVATDHGGVGFDHVNQDTVPETRFVFQIARLPNQSRVDVPVASNVDIVPTILKYMGVPIDPAWGLDGVPIF